MSHIRTHTRLILVAVCCVAVGAAASVIAGAGAATTAPTAKAHRAKVRRRGLRRIAARTVHGTFVVHTKSGFRTVTVDRGVVDSVSGQQLRITEGTPKATYKTVTLTIPGNARVRDDKRTSSLSSVKAGQRVLVLAAPRRTSVVAHTPRAH